MNKEKGLESFKEALRKEHLGKVALLERARDDEIADLVAARRIAVQKKAVAVRKEHEERFRRLAEEKRRDASASAEVIFLEEFANLRSSFCAELRNMARKLRTADRERYGRILAGLVREALDACGRPAVIFVEETDGDLLREYASKDGLFNEVEIREENLNGWGGCRAVTENEIVENTFLARWERLSPLFSLRLSRLVHDSFTDIHRRISQL